jgi:DNA gyrase subunit A
VLPLPEDEAEWKNLHIMFATAKGACAEQHGRLHQRAPPARSRCASAARTSRTHRLIGVVLLTEDDDVLSTQHGGRSASPHRRARVPEPHPPACAAPACDGDEVISLSILKAFDATPEERDAYLRAAPWKDNENEATLTPERMAEFEAAEEFILTVTENGYGKRTSAHEYRAKQSRRPGHHQHRDLGAQRLRRRQLPGA